MTIALGSAQRTLAACTRETSAAVPWVRAGDFPAHNVQDREQKLLMNFVPRDMDLWIRYFQSLLSYPAVVAEWIYDRGLRS